MAFTGFGRHGQQFSNHGVDGNCVAQLIQIVSGKSFFHHMPPNIPVCRMGGGEICPPRFPIGRKNDKQQPRVKPVRFLMSAYTWVAAVLKVDHPFFLRQSDLSFDDGGFQPDNGHAGPWRFAGSGAGLCGALPCVRPSGIPCSSRPGLASNTGKRKRKLYTIGRQCKPAARFPTLQKAGSCVKDNLLVVLPV